MLLNHSVKEIIFLSAIFLFCALLYLFRLESLPTSVHGDEGETALQAIDVLHGKTGIIGVGWFDLPLLSFLPHGLTMAAFGENVVGNRLGSALFGILTLPFFYLLVESLFTKRVAVIATALLGTSHLWIALSRVGITYVQATFFVIATFYFIVHGLKTEYKRDFFLGGIFLGLCFYSYYAARIAPFVILPYVLLHLIKSNNVKRLALQFLILLVSAIVIFAPQGKFFLENPSTFSSRTEMIYIFSETGREWTKYNKSNAEILLAQVKKTFNIFEGDNSTQYGYKGQLLDYIMLTLFVSGLLYVFKNFRITHLILIFWLLLSFLGQILTTIPTPIFLPRFVVAMPILFIFVALGIEFVLGVNKKLQRITVPALMLIIVGINLYTYFILYPKQVSGDPNARAATKIASYLNLLPSSYTALFLTAPSLYADFGTLRFLSPQRRRIDNIEGEGGERVLGAATNSNIVYILYPYQRDKLNELIYKYPGGKSLEFRDVDGSAQFLVYEIIKY